MTPPNPQKTKHIEIAPYNPDWPRQFEIESDLIKQTLGRHCIEVHHIGSTSIPGLSAKNILDILCVVDSLPESLALETVGYIHKGEYNIPRRAYFSKNKENTQVNLHVVEPDNGFITLNLCFRDYLRSHHEAREEYARLKETLLQDQTSYQKASNGFTGYALGKDEFIKGVLDKAGFEGISLNFCMHHREWAEYHRIRKEQIADLKGIIYDRDHPRFAAPNRYHFILYRGTKIIGIAEVEFISDNNCALRPFAIDVPYQNQGYGSLFLKMIEKWLKHKNQKTIQLHAAPEAVSFYERLEYVPMPFHDQGRTIAMETIDMGKVL